MPPESLPANTTLADVRAAAQAAWLAGDLALARDLVQRYIDPDSEICCMRCTQSIATPWRMNNHLGSFLLCPVCAVLVTRQQGSGSGNGEFFMAGPPQPVKSIRRPTLIPVVQDETLPNDPLMQTQFPPDDPLLKKP